MQKILLFFACSIFFTQATMAQWDANPLTMNNPVSTIDKNEFSIFSVTDGAGGVIVLWNATEQTPGGDQYYVYAQRKSSSGQVLWATAATPKQLFTSANESYITDLVADATGGAYVTWTENLTDSTSDIYVQHINSSGTALFTPGGLRINPVNGRSNNYARMVSDAAGLIVAWGSQDPDSVLTPNYFAQVYVQRFTGAGAAQWTAGGVPVCTVPGQRAIPAILGDGSNGVFIAFIDTRNSTIDVINNEFINVDIYAQHISSSGARLWGTGGVVVADQLYNQETQFPFYHSRSIVTDGNGGFIIIYNDYRNDNDGEPRLYAQRLNGSGARQWAAQGIAISPYLNSNFNFPVVIVESDGANGAVVAWNALDLQTLSGGEHAQRITGAGTLLWGANGIIVNPATDTVTSSQMAVDASGDYIFCWSRTSLISGQVLKAQKINNAGTALWAAAGVPVCTNPDSGPAGPAIVKSDGTNMIVVWMDERNMDNTDLYAGKLSTTGALIGIVAATGYTTKAAGNWGSPATWVGNAVPPAGADVVIKHVVTGNVTTTCNKLTVQSPGSLTVNTGIRITVLH